LRSGQVLSFNKRITSLLFIKICWVSANPYWSYKIRMILAPLRTPFSSGYEKQGAEVNRRNISRVEQNVVYILRSKWSYILFLSLM
jgi:hypothetical protein